MDFLKRAWHALAHRPHRTATFVMLLLVIPTVLWWKDSILWVLLLSLYANVYTSIGADEAQQAKRKAEQHDGVDS